MARAPAKAFAAYRSRATEGAMIDLVHAEAAR
jgi:hypothetical protein